MYSQIPDELRNTCYWIKIKSLKMSSVCNSAPLQQTINPLDRTSIMKRLPKGLSRQLTGTAISTMLLLKLSFRFWLWSPEGESSAFIIFHSMRRRSILHEDPKCLFPLDLRNRHYQAYIDCKVKGT